MLHPSATSEILTSRRALVSDLLAELRRQSQAAGDRRPVSLVETHLSWVLLGQEVYKIKKPVTLPFVDFSSFEERERACRAEVSLNRRLAPRTYLGVVPIRKSRGRYTFAADGPVVEWAVRMRRLDEADRADVRLKSGALGAAHIDRLATTLVAFHADSTRTRKLARVGSPEAIERNVADNFAALRTAGEDVAPHALLDEIERWQRSFLRGHEDRFERRMIDGSVRDGHGDLRLEHVFFRDPDFEVIDCIEFDDRYRVADVCADIAFLAMDLARLGRVDLAERFVATYARTANDYDLYGVLDFYESYRACVRAKIAVLSAPEEVRRHLLLAQSARRRSALQPVLVAVAGNIASGKSTLAERLAEALSAPIVDADRTRKHMLGLGPTDHASSSGAWSGAYDLAFSEQVYAEVLRRAGVVLASGRPVIVDASFRSSEARARARALASELGAPFRLLECVAAPSVCKARLAARERLKAVSDATPEIFDAFAEKFERITELPEPEHARIDTSGEPDASLEQARRIVATWPRGLVQ
jgi:aminoglycoside phosphotransferase family enzyme/predicted kinase